MNECICLLIRVSSYYMDITRYVGYMLYVYWKYVHMLLPILGVVRILQCSYIVYMSECTYTLRTYIRTYVHNLVYVAILTILHYVLYILYYIIYYTLQMYVKALKQHDRSEAVAKWGCTMIYTLCTNTELRTKFGII